MHEWSGGQSTSVVTLVSAARNSKRNVSATHNISTVQCLKNAQTEQFDGRFCLCLCVKSSSSNNHNSRSASEKTAFSVNSSINYSRFVQRPKIGQ